MSKFQQTQLLPANADRDLLFQIVNKLKEQMEELEERMESIELENRHQVEGLTERNTELECRADPYSLDGEAICNG
jgi:hypothetical protein